MKIENRNVLLKSKVASQERTRNLDSKKKDFRCALDTNLLSKTARHLRIVSFIAEIYMAP